jgi:hypothetical protein
MYRSEDGRYFWHRKAANNRKRAGGNRNKEDRGADALAVRGGSRADAAIYHMPSDDEEEA